MGPLAIQHGDSRVEAPPDGEEAPHQTLQEEVPHSCEVKFCLFCFCGVSNITRGLLTLLASFLIFCVHLSSTGDIFLSVALAIPGFRRATRQIVELGDFSSGLCCVKSRFSSRWGEICVLFSFMSSFRLKVCDLFPLKATAFSSFRDDFLVRYTGGGVSSLHQEAPVDT